MNPQQEDTSPLTEGPHVHDSATATDSATLPPVRAVIEALVTSLRFGEDYPDWVLRPATEAEFLASLVIHGQDGLAPPVSIEYDAEGRAAYVHGIRPKGGTS